MGIRRLTLAASLCAVVACGSDDSSRGADDPDTLTPTPPPDAGGFPPVATTVGGTTGFFGGVVGGIAGGPGALGGLLGGTGGFIGPGFGARPERLTEVLKAERPPHAISGGTLSVMADGSYAVAADPDLDTIYVVDAANLTVKKLALPVGSEPGRIALDAAGNAHVVLRGTGVLLRVDLASGSAAGQAALCGQARGLVYDQPRDTLVAACMDGDVVTLRAGDYMEMSRTHVAPDLRDVVLGRTGRLFATRYRSAELIALDATGAVQATNRPNQTRVTRLVFDQPPVSNPTAIVLPQGEPVQREITFSPTLAWRAATAADGGVWMLHQQSQNDEVQVTAGGYGGGSCAPITRGAVTRFAEDGAPLLLAGIAMHGTSVDLAASAQGDFLAIASPGGFFLGGGTLQVYHTSMLQDATSIDVCPGPTIVGNNPNNQVTAVAFDAQGLLYSFSREPVELEIFSLAKWSSSGMSRVATLTLDRRSNRDTGHELFHADVGTGLACASCHGEALDDGHVWTFAGIGPRRTQNMRGGFLETAPFHWDGDMVNFKKLVDDVMTGRMGGFPVNDQQADALAHWIDVQPALLLSGGDGAAVARGKALFEGSAAACASCHSGDALTNNKSADVGTGGSFQVPSLRGLGMRGPYMHDGCAPTIEARFDAACGGGDKHGKTSQLSAAQIADLSSYLRSL
jgi:mono/diheme cytochrome c family protein